MTDLEVNEDHMSITDGKVGEKTLKEVFWPQTECREAELSDVDFSEEDFLASIQATPVSSEDHNLLTSVLNSTNFGLLH